MDKNLDLCTGSDCSQCGGSGGICRNPQNMNVQIFRNRSVMEAQIIFRDTGEVADRLPVSYRSRGNKLDYLSVSKIAAYEQCPACFHNQYMSDDGIEEDNGNFFTKFGSILHEVVEKASAYYADSGIVINPMTIYDEVWKNHDLTDYPAYLEGKELIQQYFVNHPVDQRSDQALMIEHEWRGEIVPGIVFGLVVDYAGIMIDDPTTGVIKDYKTNRMPFTPSELDESFQLRTYEYVIRKFIYPDVKNWITGYEMFRFGFQQCPPRTQEDLEDAVHYIENIWHQIQHDNTWEERLNNYCGYRKCKASCKTYQDYINDPKRFIDMVICDNTDLDAVERSRLLMTSYEKIAKNRKEECSSILRSAIEQAMIKNEKLVINGEQLQLYSNATGSYNYHSTKQALAANGELGILDNCVSVQKTKLDKEIAGKPYLKLLLASCLSTNYASPYIIKSKVK